MQDQTYLISPCLSLAHGKRRLSPSLFFFFCFQQAAAFQHTKMHILCIFWMKAATPRLLFSHSRGHCCAENPWRQQQSTPKTACIPARSPSLCCPFWAAATPRQSPHFGSNISHQSHPKTHTFCSANSPH